MRYSHSQYSSSKVCCIKKSAKVWLPLPSIYYSSQSQTRYFGTDIEETVSILVLGEEGYNTKAKRDVPNSQELIFVRNSH